MNIDRDITCAHCQAATPFGDRCAECGEDPRLRGDYALLQTIGHGAIGTTHEAIRLADEQRVAVKEILVRRFESAKGMQLFDREAEALRRLDHPGIPRYYDHFVHGEGKTLGFFLVQQYVDGQTLDDEQQSRTYTDAEILEIGEELAEILAYTEGKLVHRDIKPANIIRRASDGRLFLIDFGSVRQVAHDLTDGSTITGTIGFMAPEQTWGRASFATDVYGVGMTLLSLKLGQVPTDVREDDGTVSTSLKLGALRPVLTRLLAMDPSKRPQDARELRRALKNRTAQPETDARLSRSLALARRETTEIGAGERGVRMVGSGVIIGILLLGLASIVLLGGKVGGAALLLLLVIGAIFGTVWTPPSRKR